MRSSVAQNLGRAMAPTCRSSCMLVVAVTVLLLFNIISSCNASYEESQRHQNFGKYHTPSTPHSLSPPPHQFYKPPYLPHITTPTSHGTALAVEGVVVCLSCKYARSGSLQHATPLKGAKVKLACRDMRFKTFVYETAITDKHGYFLFLVNDFEFKRHKGVRGCRVVLVSSPDTSCAKVTNVNYGKIGSPLVSREKVYTGEILYSVGPFAFAPSSSACYKH